MNEKLSERIYQKALEIGFDNCGIVTVEELREFDSLLQKRIENVPQSAGYYSRHSRFAKVDEDYPWARAVVVCVQDLGPYHLPEKLQPYYASSMFHATTKAAGIPEKKKAMQDCFQEMGIRWDDEARKGPTSFTSARFAAEKAGLGIVRRNNAFCTEQGSYSYITLWMIDADCRYTHSCTLPPCPEDCDRCIAACPTRSLTAPYTMDPLRCVSQLTTLGTGKLPAEVSSGDIGSYIWGCDECQKACPFNSGEGKAAVMVDIGDVASYMPENILSVSDETLAKEILPALARTKPESVELIKINARRVLDNQ